MSPRDAAQDPNKGGGGARRRKNRPGTTAASPAAGTGPAGTGAGPTGGAAAAGITPDHPGGAPAAFADDDRWLAELEDLADAQARAMGIRPQVEFDVPALRVTADIGEREPDPAAYGAPESTRPEVWTARDRREVARARGSEAAGEGAGGSQPAGGKGPS